MYFNRKSFYSLNVQDISVEFIYDVPAHCSHCRLQEKDCGLAKLEIGWPGSAGDGQIWARPQLKKDYEDWLAPLPKSFLPTGPDTIDREAIPPFILGDPAYANTSHFHNVHEYGDSIESCNWKVEQEARRIGARYRVENAFGIMKAGFQIFKRSLGVRQKT